MGLLPTLKALGDATRLRLVMILSQGELTVNELTEIAEMGQSRISRHLKILADAGLVAAQRQGTWRYYRSLVEQEPLRSFWGIIGSHRGEIAGHRQDLCRLQEVLERRRQASMKFFDRHACQWEALADRFLPLESWRPQVLECLPEDGVLLDLGVGTGALLPTLCTGNRRVIGIDQSPAMLAEARNRVAAEGLKGQVELRLGEMAHLPLGDAGVDAALLHLTLHHAAHPRTIFGELQRVLRPGGALVLLDLQRHELEWAREELGDQWLGFAREDLESWLTAAGFNIELYRELSGNPGPFAGFLLLARKGAS